MRSSILLVLPALVLLTAALAAAAPPVVKALKTATAPVLDGKLDDAVWQQGEWSGNFTLLGEGLKPAAAQTRFQVAFDQQNLYFGVELIEPQMDKLIARETRRDGRVHADDVLEIMVVPNSARLDYYHFSVNPLGTRYDAELRQGGNVRTTEWDANWQAKTAQGPESWTVEVAIAFVELGLTALRVPESAGGLGRPLIDGVLAASVLGRGWLLEPFVDCALAAAAALAHAPAGLLTLLRGGAPADDPPPNLASERTEEYVVELRDPLRVLRTHAGPLRDEHGAVEGRILTAEDITTSWVMQRRLTQAQRLESLARLAGGVGHDLNDLLGTISGFGALLRERTPADDPRQEAIAEILDGSRLVHCHAYRQDEMFALMRLAPQPKVEKSKLRGIETDDISPVLPLPPVPAAFKDGQDYLVTELLFSLTTREGRFTWRALVEVETKPFNAVDEQFAFEYGEGERTLAYWLTDNWDFLSHECHEIGRTPSQTMPVVFQRFRLLYP